MMGSAILFVFGTHMLQECKKVCKGLIHHEAYVTSDIERHTDIMKEMLQGFTEVLQRCYKGVTEVLQRFYKGVIGVLCSHRET
jgi:hypothetical protein